MIPKKFPLLARKKIIPTILPFQPVAPGGKARATFAAPNMQGVLTSRIERGEASHHRIKFQTPVIQWNPTHLTAHDTWWPSLESWLLRDLSGLQAVDQSFHFHDCWRSYCGWFRNPKQPPDMKPKPWNFWTIYIYTISTGYCLPDFSHHPTVAPTLLLEHLVPHPHPSGSPGFLRLSSTSSLLQSMVQVSSNCTKRPASNSSATRVINDGFLTNPIPKWLFRKKMAENPHTPQKYRDISTLEFRSLKNFQAEKISLHLEWCFVC